MARNNNYNKGSKKAMSKAKFKQAFCARCGICSPGSNPKFCYGTLYKSNPTQFTNEVFPKMMEHHEMLRDQIVPNMEGNLLLTTAFFTNILCDGRVCTKCNPKTDKAQVERCLGKFKLQCTPKYQSVRAIRQQSKKERKAAKKHTQKAEQLARANATVTVLMSDDAEFLEAVEKILGNNNKQQN